MHKAGLLQWIARKDSNKEKIADTILSNPKDIPVLLEGLNSPNARIKFGCSKVLRLASENKPEALYSRMDFFVNMLDSENTFLRMDAARVLANLVAVDTERKSDGIFEKYFAPITGAALIPAANVIGSAARIARADSSLTGRIVTEILKVERVQYATEECRNVALGHAILCLDAIFDQIEDKEPVVVLIRKQLGNTRPATRKKAEAFLRKHGIGVESRGARTGRGSTK
jgi:hypothetical protein